jgi:hypothetical protein
MRMNWMDVAKLRSRLQVAGCFFAILILCAPVFSQGNQGRITGTVTDSSGGVIAGATVTVTDTARGISRVLTTDEAGLYSAPNLTPGNYTVRAEAKGFKTLDRQNVDVEVGQEVRVDLTVQPGEQTQTVTVSQNVPLVDDTNYTLGGTLEHSEISDLPLNGRNYQNLLGLRPGVMLYPGGGSFTQVTGGVRPDQAGWMIDGVINFNFYDTRPIAGEASPITEGATILPLDSIQEFNVMENPKAEYGWKPGAVVNVGIKSGSNDFHGTAFGFYRSSNWDARNYFNVTQSPDGSCLVGPAILCNKTPAQLKQFGGSVGGPIKKDKLFFFVNYEGLRDLIGNVFGTVNGTGAPVTGPATVSPSTPNCPAAVLAVNATADCAGSMVDALNAVIANGGTPSPITLALTGCTPGASSNLAATKCTGGYWPNNQTTNAFLSTFPNVNRSDNGVAKIDYHINEKNNLNGLLIIGNYLGNGEDRGFINPIFLDSWIIKNWTASGSWDYVANSNIVNEVRFGYNRSAYFTNNDDAGVHNPVNTGATVPGLPTLFVSPFGQFGTWHNRPLSDEPNPYWDVQDNLSYLSGKHSLKFGGEYTHIEADTNTPDYGRGRISFPNLEDYFLGITTPTNAGEFFVGNAARKMLWYNVAVFGQDDWRIAPRLMLNFGLRYEYRSPIREANNLWANFDANSPTGLVQQGSPGESTMWKPDRGDFGPRLGFAYDVTGRGTTVVRGGFSIIYEAFSAVEWMGQNQTQNTTADTLGANPTGANIVVNGNTLFTGAPNGIVVKTATYTASQLCWDPSITIPGSACGSGQKQVFPSSTIVTCSNTAPCNIMGVDPNLKTPYVEAWNLGVTHAFSSNLSLDVNYVGNHGARLTGFADINQCAPYDTLNEQNLSPAPSCVRLYGTQFPWFKYVNFMSNDGRSNYNSAQLTLTKRMSHGVSFLAGYTFAHGLDNASMNRFALLPRDAFNPGGEYGNSDFDIRHRFTLTGTYNIPGIKGFAQLLQGWQINGILTVQSGAPWTVNDYSNNFSGTGDNNDTWDFFGNPSDFKATQNSIPFCSGFTVVGGAVNSSNATCTTTTGVTNIVTTPANAAAFISNCAAKAPDPFTLAAGGCYANGNSVMLPPVSGTYGTMTRNIFRDSGFRNVDFSVFKNFTWKERYTAQFRVEMFNIFNHPAFANPYGASQGSSGGNNDPSAPPAFGGAVGTPDVIAGNPLVGSGDARELQVGLKLMF